MCAIIEIGAADRIRTCDNQLGRMALYQLSYYRVLISLYMQTVYFYKFFTKVWA
jgi:hypothetical protein